MSMTSFIMQLAVTVMMGYVAHPLISNIYFRIKGSNNKLASGSSQKMLSAPTKLAVDYMGVVIEDKVVIAVLSDGRRFVADITVSKKGNISCNCCWKTEEGSSAHYSDDQLLDAHYNKVMLNFDDKLVRSKGL